MLESFLILPIYRRVVDRRTMAADVICRLLVAPTLHIVQWLYGADCKVVNSLRSFYSA